MARTNVTNINADFHAEVSEKIKEFAESLDTGLSVNLEVLDREELKKGYFSVTVYFADSEWEEALEKAIAEIGKKARAGTLNEEKKTVTKTATIGKGKAAAPTVTLKGSKIAKAEPVVAKPKFATKTIAAIVKELNEYSIDLATPENVTEGLSSIDVKLPVKFKNQIKKVSQLSELFDAARENGVNELIAFLSIVDFDADSKLVRALIEQARELDESLIPTAEEEESEEAESEETDDDNEEAEELDEAEAEKFLEADDDEEEEVVVVNRKRK